MCYNSEEIITPFEFSANIIWHNVMVSSLFRRGKPRPTTIIGFFPGEVGEVSAEVAEDEIL